MNCRVLPECSCIQYQTLRRHTCMDQPTLSDPIVSRRIDSMRRRAHGTTPCYHRHRAPREVAITGSALTVSSQYPGPILISSRFPPVSTNRAAFENFCQLVAIAPTLNGACWPEPLLHVAIFHHQQSQHFYFPHERPPRLLRLTPRQVSIHRIQRPGGLCPVDSV
jgi:hypothetical protein